MLMLKNQTVSVETLRATGMDDMTVVTWVGLAKPVEVGRLHDVTLPEISDGRWA